MVWQMMRAYTLSVLQRLAGSDKPISDPEIVEWANETLKAAGKSSKIAGFKDTSIATSMPVIDLVDAIKPGSIKYELVNQGSSLNEEVYTFTYILCLYGELCDNSVSLEVTYIQLCMHNCAMIQYAAIKRFP